MADADKELIIRVGAEVDPSVKSSVEDVKQQISQAAGGEGDISGKVVADNLKQAEQSAKSAAESVSQIGEKAAEAAGGAGDLAEGLDEAAGSADPLQAALSAISEKIGISPASLAGWAAIAASFATIVMKIAEIVEKSEAADLALKNLLGQNSNLSFLTVDALTKRLQDLQDQIDRLQAGENRSAEAQRQYKEATQKYGSGSWSPAHQPERMSRDEQAAAAQKAAAETIEEIARRRQRENEVLKLTLDGDIQKASVLREQLRLEQELEQIRNEAQKRFPGESDAAQKNRQRYETEMSKVSAERSQLNIRMIEQKFGQVGAAAEGAGQAATEGADAAAAAADGAAASLGNLGAAILAGFSKLTASNQNLQSQMNDLSSRINAQAA